MPFVILDPVKITDGTNNLAVTTGGAVKTDGTATTQPVSAASLPLPAGAATQTTLSSINDKIPASPAQEHTASNSYSSVRLTDGSTFYKPTTPTDTQPISAATLPLPTGAATETTLLLQATASNQTSGNQKAILRSGAKGASASADVTSVSVNANIEALHVKVVGGSGSTVDSNVNIVDPSGNAIATADGSAPAATRGLMIEGYDSTGAVAHRLAVDSLGRLIVAPAGSVSSQSGFSFGRAVLAAVTIVPVFETTYTEQTTNAQRSLVSASANDTSAGTGARTVKITYYDQTMAGPYTETVTMNGTTPVNTVAVNICFIEKLEVLTVGSTGSNVGIISLKAAAAGGGVTIWSIAATSNQTFGAHHYVGSAVTCFVTSLMVGIKGADTNSGFLRARNPLTAAAADIQVSDLVRAPSSGQSLRTYGTAIKVVGPSRVVGFVAPDSTSSRTYYLSFDYYDQ
jgi:hypothetical protein